MKRYPWCTAMTASMWSVNVRRGEIWHSHLSLPHRSVEYSRDFPPRYPSDSYGRRPSGAWSPLIILPSSLISSRTSFPVPGIPRGDPQGINHSLPVGADGRVGLGPGDRPAVGRCDGAGVLREGRERPAWPGTQHPSRASVRKKLRVPQVRRPGSALRWRWWSRGSSVVA